MLKHLSKMLTLLSLGLLAVAGWQYVGSLDKPGALLDSPDLGIREIEPDTSTTAAVVIRNQSWHSVRVVGLGTC